MWLPVSNSLLWTVVHFWCSEALLQVNFHGLWYSLSNLLPSALSFPSPYREEYMQLYYFCLGSFIYYGDVQLCTFCTNGRILFFLIFCYSLHLKNISQFLSHITYPLFNWLAVYVDPIVNSAAKNLSVQVYLLLDWFWWSQRDG